MAKWFRTRIREARERAGLSQAELGEKFGVTQTTICNWENGTSEPRDEQYGVHCDPFRRCPEAPVAVEVRSHR